MEIVGLRIEDDKYFDSPDGPIPAPLKFVMDVKLNEEELIPVNIDQDTHFALHNLMIEHEPPLDY